MGQGEGRDWTQEELDDVKAIFAKPMPTKLAPNDYSSNLQFQIAKLKLKEGDILLIQFPKEDVTQRIIDTLVRGFRNLFPESIKAIFVDDRFTFSVITKNEAENIVAQQRKPPERIIDLS